jgi:hypothetical protein
MVLQVEEALDKVKVSIRNLKEFKTTFQDYKARLPSYFTGDKPPKSWEFQVRSRGRQQVMTYPNSLSSESHFTVCIGMGRLNIHALFYFLLILSNR